MDAPHRLFRPVGKTDRSSSIPRSVMMNGGRYHEVRCPVRVAHIGQMTSPSGRATRGFGELRRPRERARVAGLPRIRPGESPAPHVAHGAERLSDASRPLQLLPYLGARTSCAP